MNVVSAISAVIIPLIILFVVIYGMRHKVNVYEVFTDGAAEGVRIAADILPTLIGLFLAVRIFNDSGVLKMITELLLPIAEKICTPAAVLPVIITKLFSSGSATGLMLNIFETYGPDSLEGLASAIVLSSTESVFYTMSVYLMAAGVTKSRYILPGALISILAAVIVSVVLANYLYCIS